MNTNDGRSRRVFSPGDLSVSKLGLAAGLTFANATDRLHRGSGEIVIDPASRKQRHETLTIFPCSVKE